MGLNEEDEVIPIDRAPTSGTLGAWPGEPGHANALAD